VPGDESDQSEADVLAEMLRLGAGGHRAWRQDELGAILQHQLTAPVRFDLESMEAEAAGKLGDYCAANGLLLNSFGDLFFHPNPPLELLELTRRFGKACRNHPDSPLPHEIAMLLYLTSIVVALLRCGRRITEMDDAALRRSLRWLIAQRWVDERVRVLLTQGLQRLSDTSDAAV